ncbi:MAG: tRNA (adenosine(37)-N6)-threonylcarbamoyltransferase complex ATPase subunit type 1 TsaE [Candidatus Taylorbacteria bacterium]|nr:tRNA (adenosine(37)-N6)-threonylcarbamoyltransferase complex ATPase subunit type 1 TsaE [Candidatus Taylorbacteria bacterium]
MISKSLEETAKIAKGLADKIRPHASRAAVLALSGDLGSGKTTFSKAFAAALGIHESEVSSPTFVIMKSYDLHNRNHFKKFIHIDAYRLERAEEVERLGWKETIGDPGNLVLIEWPENIGGALPKEATTIRFKFVDEVTREIYFD